MSRKLFVALPIIALALGGTACASKKFVRQSVGDVNDKVDSLGRSVEETQQRTRQNEGRISEVDQRAQAAAQSAQQANDAASAASNIATAAGTRAEAAGQRAEAVNARADAMDKASKRLVYEVVLNEAEGNFKFGKADLPDEAKAEIDHMIEQLKADPKGAYFEIEGHTDNVGGKEINDKVGMERAEAVKKYLYTQHSIPLFKMNVISYGEEKPIGDNKTKDGRAQNRRVVIRVLI